MKTLIRRLLFMLPVLAVDAVTAAPEVPQLLPGQGFMLVQLYGQDDRSLKRLEMRNVDTGESIRVVSTRWYARGPASWLEVVAVPAGRYHWSEVQLGYRNSPVYEFDQPRGPNYVFEVVEGAVTYVGDWLIDGFWLEGEPRVPTTHNVETLHAFAEKFPAHATHYDIFISIEGREPVAASELPIFTRSP